MQGIAEKLEWIQLSLGYFLPELLLCVGVLILLLVSLFAKAQGRVTDALALIFFAGTFILSLLQYNEVSSNIPLFSGMLRLSNFPIYLKILIDLAAVLTVLLSYSQQERKGEYYALIATATLGAHLLVMSSHLVMAFLSLELVSLPSYALAAFGFQKKSMEAALKYFLFGSVASAIMLYGMSMLYGQTLTLDFTSTEFTQAIFSGQNYFLIMSVCFVLVGFLFKMSSAPVHPWAPDVYEASPTPVVAYFSVVPKLAGLGILIHFVQALNMEGSSSIRWYVIISLIAMLTLIVGNFAALLQKNPKRMMAYSSIAQSGFLLIGAITLTEQSIAVMLYYSTAFLLANYLVFWYIAYFERQAVVEIVDYAGIGRTYPFASIMLLIGLVSLTGLPPTAGFMAKLFIFSSLWTSYESTQTIIYLMVFFVGLLNTVVSLFFYLKIPYQAFLKTESQPLTIKKSILVNLFGIIVVIMLLALFFMPAGLMGWLNRINFAL
jgi:NADH-quinone oxidoreductase subunit N